MRLDVHLALDMLSGHAWKHHTVVWAWHLDQSILELELKKGFSLSLLGPHHELAHPRETDCRFSELA